MIVYINKKTAIDAFIRGGYVDVTPASFIEKKKVAWRWWVDGIPLMGCVKKSSGSRVRFDTYEDASTFLKSLVKEGERYAR